jgi:tetratricopeptide (TPR) repeat protein
LFLCGLAGSAFVLTVIGMFVLGRRRALQRLLPRAYAATYQDGDWERALGFAAELERAHSEVFGRHMQVIALNGSGRRGAEQQLVRELLRRGPYLHEVNAVISSLVSAGSYRRALEVDVENAKSVLRVPQAFVLEARALAEINRAEAEYNLGKWAEAEARLTRTSCDQGPLARTGHRLQLAWILAHTGRGQAALAAWREAQIEALPGIFRAEYHFTNAAALLCVGNAEGAEQAAAQGLSLAKRASSTRNGLFLLARAHAAREHWPEAESLCRRAAERADLGQGGDGLLLWGDILQKLERPHEAVRAWGLAVERDPESESAERAKQRLHPQRLP